MVLCNKTSSTHDELLFISTPIPALRMRRGLQILSCYPHEIPLHNRDRPARLVWGLEEL